MHCIDLLDQFYREIEVLELNDQKMVYAIDRKTEEKDLCSIETINLQTKEIKNHILLDYTRLYESFRTYNQMKDYFYAVNVLADYRLRLRKISKHIWNIDMDILIQPEGEIVNIYSLNEDYLIIYDEVKIDSDILKKYSMNITGRRYVNICYLYEIKTGKKYPINDKHFYSLTEELPVCYVQGINTLVLEVFYNEEYNESSDSNSVILMVSIDELINQVKADGFVRFSKTFKPDFGFDYLRMISVDNNKLIYRQRNCENQKEQIIMIIFEEESNFDIKVLSEYTVPTEGEILYDTQKLLVYHCCEEEDAPVKQINCLNNSELQWTYDGKYGTFAYALDENSFVTTYYEEVFLKEYEYHEYAAIHTTQHIDAFEGKCEHNNNTIIKMRSFLAL